MKRDMDLARQILLELETSDDAVGHGWGVVQVEGRPAKEIFYHVMLLAEASLIEAKDCSHTGEGGFDWRPMRLTWPGHEFLDAAREEGRWQKAKKVVMERAGGVSFDVLKAVRVKMATDAVLGT
jgi:hypothetical protein